MSRSRAWRVLRTLQPGDPVPAALYILDYRNGTRPTWTVDEARELDSGGRVLILADRDNSESRDLFGPVGAVVALTVITHPGKTLRSQAHRLGLPMGQTLCDLDQQGRHATKREVAAC